MKKMNQLSLSMANIGPAIHELRKQHHLTQAKFATKIHVDASLVSKVERGAYVPNVSFLISVCVEFNVDMNSLFGIKPKLSVKDFTGRQLDKLSPERKAYLDRTVELLVHEQESKG